MTTIWETVLAALCISAAIVTPLSGTATSRRPFYTDECRVWQQLDSLLEREDNMNITCEQNPLCTGIDCTGHYKYTGVLSAFQTFTVDTCTGLALLPCSNPLKVYIYVELPNKNVNFSRTFEKSEQVAIPNARIDAGQFGKIDPFLKVDMNVSREGNQRYVLLGVKIRVRVSIAGTWEQWPEDMQVNIVPDTKIPVPACNPAIHNSPHPRSTCDPHHFSPAPYHPTPPTPVGPKTSCVPNEASSCGHNQMCIPYNNDKNGVCACLTKFNYNDDTKKCVPKNNVPTPVPKIDPAPSEPAPTPSKGISKQTMIIIGCTVGGVVILGAMVLLVIIKYRRYRAHYASHMRLIETADNDDDDINT